MSVELLSPAGSAEAVRAAVACGADAVYMGAPNFNARRNAKNLTSAELRDATDFCRERGVKTYLTLNTIATDREFEELSELIKTVRTDAVIVTDLGVARLVREISPALRLHASTQMTIHNIDGVYAAEQLGFSRVVLSRELSLGQIEKIAEKSPLELEVFCHGALCMSYSGQCYLSGIIGRRSGNRGMCAQPCRLSYHVNDEIGDKKPLSLKDLCLAERIPELQSAGVSCLKIEGRMKRSEYVACVTGIYRKLISENRAATCAELSELDKIFSRNGFTKGYFEAKPGEDMFGWRDETKSTDEALCRRIRAGYEDNAARIPLRFYCVVQTEKPMLLACHDCDGNKYVAEGPTAESARTRALDEETLVRQIQKTGDTAYVCKSVEVKLEPGLSVPLSKINSLRRECIEAISAARIKKDFPIKSAPVLFANVQNRAEPPRITVSLCNDSQFSDELYEKAARVFVPLGSRLCEKYPRLGVTLPRIHDARVEEMLSGVTAKHIMCGNISQIRGVSSLGFIAHGGFSLNIFNSAALEQYARLGLSTATLSTELSFAQIRDISKVIPCGIVVYGRLPVMLCENKIAREISGGGYITDRTGAVFPIIREFDKTALLNSQKLYLADKREDYRALGLHTARLIFTTENSRECLAVLNDYLQAGDKTPPVFTRGLYYRGVL